jgi:iron complex transport system substrate-binding protein
VPPPTPFPRTLHDALGNAVTLPKPPQRIVSQTLGSDEILFFIVDIVRARNLPAVTTVEVAIRLKPDIVFVASYSRADLTELLRASGVPVFRFANFDKIDDIKTNVKIIGRITGEDAKADALVADMDRRLAAIAKRIPAGPRPKVMSFATDGYTAGTNTLFDDELRAAGGINASAEHGIDGFVRISAEQVLKWDPDFIVTGAKPGREDVSRQNLLSNPAVAASRAARAGHIIVINTREFLTAGHHVVDAAEALADALHGKR